MYFLLHSLAIQVIFKHFMSIWQMKLNVDNILHEISINGYDLNIYMCIVIIICVLLLKINKKPN